MNNGGFERVQDDTRFAEAWRPHSWGDRVSPYSVRIDRTYAHNGEHSLAVRAAKSASRPGAFASVVLQPGTYELSFWAVTDVDKEAAVGGHVCGEAIPTRSIGDEWQRVVAVVEIEKTAGGQSIGLWVDSPMVRVWFDDVDLRRVE